MVRAKSVLAGSTIAGIRAQLAKSHAEGCTTAGIKVLRAKFALAVSTIAGTRAQLAKSLVGGCITVGIKALQETSAVAGCTMDIIKVRLGSFVWVVCIARKMLPNKSINYAPTAPDAAKLRRLLKR